MAPPVGRASAASAAGGSAEAPPRAAAPRGVGDAPSRIEGAPQPKPRGIAQTAVDALRNFLSALCRKIYEWIWGEVPNKPDPLLKILEDLRRGSQPYRIWRYFHQYFPTEEDKNGVYKQIGSETGRWWGTNLAVGQAEATRDASVLIPYIIHEIEFQRT